MDLKSYFESNEGIGVLATADAQGKVDVAIYARPHVLDEQTVAFIMGDRLTHRNLQSNPHAAFLFVERTDDGGENRWQGKRLFLTKTSEEKDTERLHAMRRVRYGDDRDGRFLVSFGVDRVLPLIGPGSPAAAGPAAE